MGMFQIRYGLGGSFGGCEMQEWEDCTEASTLDEAQEIAYQRACEEYEQYDGMHGILSVEQIMEEDGVDEDEARILWEQDRESWLDYEAREAP